MQSSIFMWNSRAPGGNVLKSVIRYGSAASTVALLLLASQAVSASTSASKSGTNLAQAPVVSDAYAHATVPGQQVGAAYMRIVSPYSTTLKRIESGAAEHVEVHQMHKHDGVMKMRQVQELKLPADTEVVLASGGMHLMLIQLKKPLKTGEEVPLKLTFATPNKEDVHVFVNAPVRPLGK